MCNNGANLHTTCYNQVNGQYLARATELARPQCLAAAFSQQLLLKFSVNASSIPAGDIFLACWADLILLPVLPYLLCKHGMRYALPVVSMSNADGWKETASLPAV